MPLATDAAGGDGRMHIVAFRASDSRLRTLGAKRAGWPSPSARSHSVLGIGASLRPFAGLPLTRIVFPVVSLPELQAAY